MEINLREAKQQGAMVPWPQAPIAQTPTEYQHSIAERMESLALELRAQANVDALTAISEPPLLSLASRFYSARRKVDEIFGMDGFSISPAWDIMLDLFQASAKGRQVSITSASIGAGCPQTTALRWLHALETMGLLIRRPDPDDGRRSVVEITQAAIDKTRLALRAHL